MLYPLTQIQFTTQHCLHYTAIHPLYKGLLYNPRHYASFHKQTTSPICTPLPRIPFALRTQAKEATSEPWWGYKVWGVLPNPADCLVLRWEGGTSLPGGFCYNRLLLLGASSILCVALSLQSSPHSVLTPPFSLESTRSTSWAQLNHQTLCNSPHNSPTTPCVIPSHSLRHMNNL